MRLVVSYACKPPGERRRVAKIAPLDGSTGPGWIDGDWVDDNWIKDDAMNDAQQQRSLIVGLGKTGLSCARFLSACNVPVLVVDSREAPPELACLREELPEVEVQLGAFDNATFLACKEIVLSPGVSLQAPAIATAVAAGVPVIGDIDLFARHVNAPVLAITGSNGKSTVTALLYEILRDAGKQVAMGGNIGTPALELIGNDELDFYVLELSSFQLETTHELNAVASVILNLSPDHLDRYDSFEQYLDAKQRIFRGDGVVIWNRDDELLSKIELSGRSACSFGMDEPSDNDFGVRIKDSVSYLAKGDQLMMPVDQLALKGAHNIANALAAAALADSVGISEAAMVTALKQFSGLPHRMQWVAEKNGITWFNDSKGTNVGAAVAALQGLESKVVLIAGGVGKDADFSPLKPVLAEKARAVVLLGQDALLIEAAIDGAAPVIHVNSMEAAVAQAVQLAQPGDAVLLSPACASFDMFSGFEARGDVFVAAVREVLA